MVNPAPVVLVIEDDPSLRHLLTRILKTEGFHVLQAGSGEEALRLFEHENFEALVLDYQLPDTTGEVLIAELRRRGFDQPVVLCTAHPRAQSIFQKINAQGVLAKPFDPFQLVSLLRSLIVARQASMEGSE